jgi:hypothetical protein
LDTRENRSGRPKKGELSSVSDGDADGDGEIGFTEEGWVTGLAYDTEVDGDDAESSEKELQHKATTADSSLVIDEKLPHLPYRSMDSYFEKLEPKLKSQLDRKVMELRSNPTAGTDEWEVLLHANMDAKCDNLYFACYIMKGMTYETVQLVKALPYDDWRIAPLERLPVRENGDWNYIVLQPFWKDADLPNERSRWRYQLHHYKPGEDGGEFSKGFYSFDDPASMPTGTNIAKWEEPVSLLRGQHFVYGPFSWKKKPGGKTIDYEIDYNDWKQALPAILARCTKQGSLFWKGFEDSLLLECDCTYDEIVQNRFYDRFTPGTRWLPIRYESRDSKWRSFIQRCLPYQNLVRWTKTPHCWEGKTQGAKGRRVAGWMEMEKKANADADTSSRF